jgi:hypothetical protein
MQIEILDGETVIRTIEAEPEFAEQHYPGAWRLAAVQTEVPAPPALRHMTKLGFRNRFAQPEKAGIEFAALDDPSAPMPARQQAAAVRAYLADVAAATYIDLDRQDLRDGVQALEAMGLLASGRAAEILDAPLSDIERYKGV